MFLNLAYDGLGLPLYIVDLDTYEVLYINEEGKKIFGDITGRRCYEALNGTGDTCDLCLKSYEILKDAPRCTKARYLAAFKKYFDIYENLITMPDETNAKLCIFVDVTEQEEIRLDNELKEQTQKNLQHLLDIQSGFIRSAKSMMSAAGLDGKMIFVNETMSNILGYTQEEILQLSISDFHSPDDIHLYKEKYLPESIRNGVWKGDSTVLKKDGTYLPVRQTIFPICDENGEVISTATIMEDITKSLELERMNRYQIAIMNSSKNYIGVSDLNGKTMYHSPGAYRMMGYESGEIGDWDMKEPHPEWYLNRIINEGIPYAIKNGEWVGRGELIDRYGNNIPIEQTIFPVFDENNQHIGVATIISDIAEKVSQEKELEAGRRMLRTIIDTAPSAIFWKDKNSRFLGANKAFANDAGLDDPEKLIGKSDYDLYPKEAADMYTAADKKIFETNEEILYIEEPFYNPDGSLNWKSTSKVLLRDENNEPFALLGIYDDITKIKMNELKLEDAIKTAKEASMAKSDFLSRMSHEIRTPLNAILGMTKLGRNAVDIERMYYCFDKIDGASKHLLGLINDILDMSKIEANKLELTEEPFDFEKMLESIYNVINVKAEEKNQRLTVRIDENIPVEIIADEMRISQVVTNLLSNAVKFTPDNGSISLHAVYHGETDDGRIKLSVSVKDTGIGLNQEQISKLFRSFEQAEVVTSRKYGGTGLGLAISKRIVEMMDGDITVSSELNAGSEFTFTILVKKNKKSTQTSYNFDPYTKIRVLVVDDEEDILKYFTRLLGNYKIPCTLANNGANAVELVAKGLNEGNNYDIIFIDYLMDEMNGIETTRNIKALAGNSVNVIMVSQTEWAAIEEEARIAGVDKFISKPLFQSPILDCINQLIFEKDILNSGGSYGIGSDNDNIDGIFQGKKILLAEDIEINREIVMALLEPTEIEIDCAVNGEEAVNIFAVNPDKYDIIIMDVQMPMMDGLEATRQIRAINIESAKTIPIIAMTANAFAEDIDACINAGMVDHLGKPIDFDVLIDKLKMYLF